jgi:hypothetical protein
MIGAIRVMRIELKAEPVLDGRAFAITAGICNTRPR